MLAQYVAKSARGTEASAELVAMMVALRCSLKVGMRQAERALRKEGSSVARVAHTVGYGSEAAFSTAFKRVMGHSPRRGIIANGTSMPYRTP